MEKVTVYSKEDCSQCDMTKKVMDSKEIPYEERRIDLDEEALAYVKELGYLAAPVVTIEYDDKPMEHFYGFRPDMIGKIALKGIVEIEDGTS